MNIDPNSPLATPGQAYSGAQGKLSPELEHLLAQLKVRMGETLTATVNRISQISEADYQALLQIKPQASPPVGRQAWQSLLSQPSLKRVELQHQQSSFSAITDLPVVKGQQLVVVVTHKGLQLLLDPANEGKSANLPAATSQSQTSLRPPPMPFINQTVQPLPLVNSKPTVAITDTPVTAKNSLLREAPAPTGSPRDSSPPQSTQTFIGTAIPKPIAAAIATKADSPLPLIPSPVSTTISAPATASHNRAQPLLSDPGTLQNSRPAIAAKEQPNSATVRALAQAVANALPKAQPTSLLLPSSSRLAALLQHIPEHSVPPALKPLMPLLNKLQQQPLDLVTNKPLPAAVIAKAINNNGVFHERNALQMIERNTEAPTVNLADDDIKALLIKTLDSLGQPVSRQSPQTSSKLLSTDAVARLWLSLVNGLGNKQETQNIPVSKKENLLQLAQTFAQNSLAKIQLNQYRSVTAGSKESGSAAQVIHLDIPIRWPDHYGNAYLQISPPKVQEEESDSKESKQKRDRRCRWRIFMELEMGEEGSLAVELTVANDQIDATFWAEKDELRQKAAAQLQHLRTELTEQGLKVADLRCSSNPPPEQKINLDYALIDVRT